MPSRRNIGQEILEGIRQLKRGETGRTGMVTAAGSDPRIQTGQGIYWPDLDEDISVEGMLRGTPAPRPKSP